MNLYIVMKQVGRENYDGLVWANTPNEAAYLWKQADWVIDDIEEEADRIPERIFHIPAVPPLDVILKGPHLLAWWTDELPEVQ